VVELMQFGKKPDNGTVKCEIGDVKIFFFTITAIWNWDVP
jgi:hypothetical protein